MTPSLVKLTSDIRAARVDARRLCEDALVAASAAGGAFWELAGAQAGADAAAVVGFGPAESGRRLLAGVPVAVKDAFAVSGSPQHLGLTRSVIGDRDAVAVARLREAGAVVIGTTAMDQLGWTMTGQAPGYPPYENPIAPGHSPGGSSGGAAAAVAAGVVPLALAADTAGSVRVPAAWCGVVAFKPTFGAIELDGCAPLAPDFDTAGVIARGVDDCRLAFAALSCGRFGGLPAGLAAPRVGVPAALIDASDCDPAVLTAWTGAVERLRSARIAVRDVAAPPRPRGVGALFAANLAARWGDVVDAEPPDLVHPEVRAGVAFGRSLTVRDYILACDALAAARRAARSVFDNVDLLVVPTAPILPRPLDEPASVAVVSALARPWSVFGWPAITIPCATAEIRGFGIQLVARPGDDMRLLSWARDVEDVLGD